MLNLSQAYPKILTDFKQFEFIFKFRIRNNKNSQYIFLFKYYNSSLNKLEFFLLKLVTV